MSKRVTTAAPVVAPKPGAAPAPSAPAAPASTAADNTSVEDLAARLSKNKSGAKAATAAAPGTQAPAAVAPSNEPTEPVDGGTSSASPQPDPAEPPVEPVEPTEPTEPAEPADPADPADPTEPTEPGDPAEPEPGEPDANAPDIMAVVRALVTEAGGDPEKLNTKVIKRFASLTARFYDAESRASKAEEANTQLSERLEQSQANGAQVLNPAPFHKEITALDQQLAASEQVLQWAAENPDGAEVSDGKGGIISYTPAQVRQFKAQAETRVTKLSVARETKLAKVQEEHNARVNASQAKAKEVYPWTKNPRSAEMTEAIAIVREIPEITLRADWPLLVADMVEGRKAREAKGKAPAARAALGAPLTARPPGSRTPPAVVAAPAAAAPRVDAKQRTAEQTNDKFHKTGSIEDLTALLAAKRAARQQRVAA